MQGLGTHIKDHHTKGMWQGNVTEEERARAIDVATSNISMEYLETNKYIFCPNCGHLLNTEGAWRFRHTGACNKTNTEEFRAEAWRLNPKLAHLVQLELQVE